MKNQPGFNEVPAKRDPANPVGGAIAGEVLDEGSRAGTTRQGISSEPSREQKSYAETLLRERMVNGQLDKFLAKVETGSKTDVSDLITDLLKLKPIGPLAADPEWYKLVTDRADLVGIRMAESVIAHWDRHDVTQFLNQTEGRASRAEYEKKNGLRNQLFSELQEAREASLAEVIGEEAVARGDEDIDVTAATWHFRISKGDLVGKEDEVTEDDYANHADYVAKMEAEPSDEWNAHVAEARLAFTQRERKPVLADRDPEAA